MKITTLVSFFAVSIIAIFIMAGSSFGQQTVTGGHFKFIAEQRLCLQNEKSDSTFHTATFTRVWISGIQFKETGSQPDKLILEIKYVDSVYGPIVSSVDQVPRRLFLQGSDNSIADSIPHVTIDSIIMHSIPKSSSCKEGSVKSTFRVTAKDTLDLGRNWTQDHIIEGGLAIVVITQDPCTSGNLSPIVGSYRLLLNGTPLDRDASEIGATGFKIPPSYEKLDPGASATGCGCTCPSPIKHWFDFSSQAHQMSSPLRF